LSPEEEKKSGLTRERLVAAALDLINREGLEALSMRALADELEVKAASLYWHVRDRRELIELLAESILETVPRPRHRSTWRDGVLAIAEALRRRVSAQKDAGRVLLEVPDALERSDTFADLKAQLQSAGLHASEAAEIALLAMTYVIADRSLVKGAQVLQVEGGKPASIAIDSGSRGVLLRAGSSDMRELIRVPHEQAAASPAVVRGETVVVRRLRGVGRGEIELNPRRPWRFKIQAPTWNTVLDLPGVDVKEIHVDSGATNLECFLPEPQGVVPIHLSSGVVNVKLHRPRGAAIVALVHTGTLKLKLDDFSTKVVLSDLRWQSEGASNAPNRYELNVSGGVVDLHVDEYTPTVQPVDVPPVEPVPEGKPASALDILLDGVESRVRPNTR
jgi:TetR/AcrR family tetracycline transcriptional repressor